jgi:long-chain acyl-CoA synthetase
LESYAPSAIITHAFFLPQLLELVYDTEEKRTTEHIIVVVGEPTPQAMSSVASNVKILSFANLEREGVKVEKVLSPLPSLFVYLQISLQSIHPIFLLSRIQ